MNALNLFQLFAQAPQNPAMAQQKQALLAQLADALPPGNIGFWPLAPGWWILIFIIIVTAVTTARFYVNYRRDRKYRTAALRELDTIRKEYKATHDISITLSKLTGLTKRVCFTCDPINKEIYANLYGRQWWQQLNTYLKKPLPLDGIAFESQYSKTPEMTSQQMVGLIRHTEHWIRKHRVKRNSSAASSKAKGSQHV